MRILLDTNILLWTVGQSSRLGPTVKDDLSDPLNTVFFSTASIWEIAIKYGLKRTDFPIAPGKVAAGAALMGFTVIPLGLEVAASVATLPMHHRDPFDRLLIAQALAGPMRFYTADAALVAYSDLVHLAC